MSTPYTVNGQRVQDENARDYLLSLRAGVKPKIRPDVGRWVQVVDRAEEAYEVGTNGDKAILVRTVLADLMKRLPELEVLLSEGPQPDVFPEGHSPQPASTIEQSLSYPKLPESAQLPPGLATGVCQWLDRYVKYSKLVSPLGFEDFHEACGLEVLSTAVAGRIEIPSGPDGQHTPLMFALVAKPGERAKSTTAQVYVKVLRAAGLGWLLGADETTPQKFMSDCVGYIPSNYFQLSEEKQQRWKQRLAMPGQRGWYYDELGAFFRAMNKPNGPMGEFRGLLLKLDNRAPSYTYATQSRGNEEIEKPYLALLGCTTFADFRSVAKTGSDEWNDGMLSRFIPIVPPPGPAPDKSLMFESFPVPFELTSALWNMHEWLGIPEVDIIEEDDEKSKGKKPVIKVLRERTERVIRPDREVEAAFNRYLSALKQMKKPEDLASSYVRLPIKALRIAALFAGLDRTQTITLRYWALAQEIAERWRVSVHRLYEQANNSPNLPTKARRLEDEIVRIIRHLVDEKREKPPTLRDLGNYIKWADSGLLKMTVADMKRTCKLSENKEGKSPRYSVTEEVDE